MASVVLSTILFTAPSAEHVLDQMTLEQKIAQIMMVSFDGEVINDDAKALVKDLEVGGIIYYTWANGLHNPDQIRDLSAGLQRLSNTPLFIAADQEGGIVARLQNGFTVFPGNRALGATEDPELAKKAALAMGQEMQAVGVNTNFAPVVDVNSNPKNPIIGIRSFGENPSVVTAFGEKALEGFKDSSVIGCLKHFPGHGDTGVDSHLDLPVIHKSVEELKECEFVPFAKLASSADMIMTAHISIPALDKENCSTLSEKTLTYLRSDLGFKGVIVSDSLLMDGVLKSCQTIDEAAKRALSAGCDILLLGGSRLNERGEKESLSVPEIQAVHASLVQAVQKGEILEARINDAALKVLELKKKQLGKEFNVVVDKESHALLAQEIAQKALKIEVRQGVDLKEKNVFLVAPKGLEKDVQKTTLQGSNAYFFEGLNPQEKIGVPERADVIVVFSYNAWKNRHQKEMVDSFLETGKQVIVIATRDPMDADLFPKASVVLKTFSPTLPSLQAACNALKD